MSKIIGYKCFDQNLKCRDFQFEIGKTYIAEGEIELCGNGFHFYQDTKYIFNYYDNCEKTRICLVECENFILGHDKAVCQKITILRELSYQEICELLHQIENNKFDISLHNGSDSGFGFGYVGGSGYIGGFGYVGGSGFGFGSGSGYGSGYGSGFGDGSGAGSSYGDGSGFGYVGGSGFGFGSGSGFGFGSGDGSGAGYDCYLTDAKHESNLKFYVPIKVIR